MVYVRAKGNIRKPRRSVRRRAPVRRRAYRRRAPARRRSTRSMVGYDRVLTPASKFALAQLDPFELKCLGAKIPDSTTIPSLSHSDVDQVSLAAPPTAGLLVAQAFNPSYVSAQLNANQLSPTPSATQIAWDGNFVARRNFSKMSTSIEAYRPVAHAIRLSCGLSPTTATGFVHLGLCVESRRNNDFNTTVPNYPDTVNDMTGLAFYRRVTLASLTQSPITIINKWIDDTGFRYDDFSSAYNFAPSSSSVQTITFNFQQSWGTLIVMVEGAPTGAPVLNAEHILHSELLPQKDGFVIGTPAAASSPGAMSVVSQMQGETDFSHTEAEQESYIQRGMNEISRGASVAGEQVFVNVAAPLLNRVGQAAVYTASAMAIQAMSGRGGLPGINSNPARLAM